MSWIKCRKRLPCNQSTVKKLHSRSWCKWYFPCREGIILHTQATYPSWFNLLLSYMLCKCDPLFPNNRFIQWDFQLYDYAADVSYWILQLQLCGQPLRERYDVCLHHFSKTVPWICRETWIGQCSIHSLSLNECRTI